MSTPVSVLNLVLMAVLLLAAMTVDGAQLAPQDVSGLFGFDARF